MAFEITPENYMTCKLLAVNLLLTY